LKTKILNTFRNIFKNTFFEKIIISLIRASNNFVLFEKLAPNCYQYPKNTFREYDHKGIKLNLNISDYIQHYIYFSLKDVSHDKLLELLDKNAVVLDVGGNIGYTALRMAQIVGEGGKIYTFEPDPLNYSNLTKNLSLNSFKNIFASNIGLGAEYKQVKLFVNTESNRGGNRINELADSNFEIVKIVPLDRFVADNSIDKIDLIKIDVEGYELKVLKGANEILRKHRPLLFIEFDNYNLTQQNDSAKELIAYLKEFNYKISHAETGDEITGANLATYLDQHFDIVCRP